MYDEIKLKSDPFSTYRTGRQIRHNVCPFVFVEEGEEAFFVHRDGVMMEGRQVLVN